MEWNLVCSELWMKAAEQVGKLPKPCLSNTYKTFALKSFFMTGALVGSFLFGKASDIFGRKPTLIFALGVAAFFGIVAGVLPSKMNFNL